MKDDNWPLSIFQAVSLSEEKVEGRRGRGKGRVGKRSIPRSLSVSSLFGSRSEFPVSCLAYVTTRFNTPRFNIRRATPSSDPRIWIDLLIYSVVDGLSAIFRLFYWFGRVQLSACTPTVHQRKHITCTVHLRHVAIIQGWSSLYFSVSIFFYIIIFSIHYCLNTKKLTRSKHSY